MAFSSVEGLLQAAGQVPLWRAVLEDDLRERGVDEARSWGQMAALWTAMKAPVAEYDPAARSRSGLTGGAGARLEGEGPGLCPPFLRQVNIATMQLYRDMRGGLAVMVIESDQPIWAAAVEELRACPGIERVTYLNMEGED